MDDIQIAGRSTGDIMQDVARDFGDIVRAEMRLARAELIETAGTAGKAAGMLGGAAVSGLLAGMCLAATGIALLALLMPLWLASLIIAVLLLIAAGAMYAMGRTRFSQISPKPERTIKTLKEDIEWAKHHAK